VVEPVVGASGIVIRIFRVAICGVVISIFGVAAWHRVVSCILATLLGVEDKVVGNIKEGMGR